METICEDIDRNRRHDLPGHCPARVCLPFVLFMLFGVGLAWSHIREVTIINEGWRFGFGGDSCVEMVNIPHCWNGDAYVRADYRRGVGRYVKELMIPTRFKGKRLFLKFDGAANSSRLSVNGHEIGHHVGGYSPYTVDFTPLAMAGSRCNVEVEVDNSPGDIPPLSADFTFMGGLYRDVWLIATGHVHLDILDGPAEGFRTEVRQDKNGRWELRVAGNVVNDSIARFDGRVTVMLEKPDGGTVAFREAGMNIGKGDRGKFDIKFDNLGDIEVWSPESPSLYRLTVRVESSEGVSDEGRGLVGFRSFGFDGDGRFILNGDPYKLRGMCRHQDQAPFGIALSDEIHRRDMRLIKDMGANFIRISHYPQDDAVLEMCDRLGLIVWEEIPVIDIVPDSRLYADNAERMLREMIRSHYNHSSVAMWGYMNEILLKLPVDGREATLERTRRLARRLERVVSEEDSTRMSAMAFHGSDIYHEAGLGEITDIKGWNLYQGWYGGELDGFEEFLTRQHRDHPSHPIIVSEYGAGSDLRLHTLCPSAFDFSVEYQQQFLEHYLPVIERTDYVAGASHWNFIDFSSANRAESMPGINNKGVVTNNRREKDVYYYFKAAWSSPGLDTVAHIAVRDWPERVELTDSAGIVIRPVKVYTNLAEVALRVNGVLTPSRKVDNFNAVFDVGLHRGENIIELFDALDMESPVDVAKVKLSAFSVIDGRVDPGMDELAVNVGSRCYFRSDRSGHVWLPDREYSSGTIYGHVGGRPSVCHDRIGLTEDTPLLQTSMTGLDSYRFDVVDGEYEIELLFADCSTPENVSVYLLGRGSGENGPGGVAKMDISINGRIVEEGFAPVDVVGAKCMVKRRYHATADGGSGLTVSFTPSEGGFTSLSAISVRKQ